MPIPPKTAEQTKAILMQFPVSSGQHHRLNESEWVPVVPPKQPKNKETQEQSPAETSTTSKSATTTSKSATATQAKAKDDEVPQPTAGKFKIEKIIDFNLTFKTINYFHIFLLRLWLSNHISHCTASTTSATSSTSSTRVTS